MRNTPIDLKSSKIHYRTSLDIRAKDDGDGFDGHAASWWSVDSYGTVLAPGSFAKTIKERKDKIPVLWNHNPNSPIGKHIELAEDTRGLYVNVGIADDGAEGSTLLKRLRFGVPLGLSFGFETIKYRTAEDNDPIDMSNAPSWVHSIDDVLVITEVKLWETSPVTFPANADSTIDDIRAARQEQEADYLTSLLEDLRAGRVAPSDVRHTLLQDIVAAYQPGTEPKPDPSAGTTPLNPEDARRDRETVLVSLAALCGMTVEQFTCAA